MHEVIAEAFSLHGRVAVVTGAASGLGREAAVVLAEAGATPVLGDIDAAGLEQTAAMVADAGGRPQTHTVDVAQRAQLEALADRAAAVTGRVDIWVNVAGILVNRTIIEAREDEVDRMIAINLKGIYWGCAAAARVMRPAGKGSIVNFSSSGADSVVPGLSLYAMTKAGVNMVTRTAAKEFGAWGIRVNAIAPGWVETPMGTHRFRDEGGAIDPARRAEGIRQRAETSPLGIVGTPRDIALGVLYLASDASRFVTGQNLRINGGVSMP
ncbi:MAG: SDR family oxidoreductase [Novosphingobium sp.]